MDRLTRVGYAQLQGSESLFCRLTRVNNKKKNELVISRSLGWVPVLKVDRLTRGVPVLKVDRLTRVNFFPIAGLDPCAITKGGQVDPC